jgi:hypothetical protein
VAGRLDVYSVGAPNMSLHQVTLLDRRSRLTRVLYEHYNTYIHTYHSRFIPEGVAELSQIFPRDTHVLPKLVSYEERCRRGRW